MKLHTIITCLLVGAIIALISQSLAARGEKPIEYNLKDAILESLAWPGLVDSEISAEDIPVLEVKNGESIFVADSSINDFATGFVVRVGNIDWFIPEIVAEWHPIIHISSGEEEIFFTFDVFCRSGNVYSDNVNYTGKYYEGNLLLEKDGEYFWQLSGKGITTDSALESISYKTITWDDFKEDYPYGRAVSLITGFNRDYGRHPYGSYLSDEKIYFPATKVDTAHKPKDNIFFTRSESGTATVNEDLESEQAFWHCLQNQFDIINL